MPSSVDSRPRLLLVEDDRDIRTAVAEALRGEGYDVRALPDGRDTAALTSYPVDLAVLDVTLPGPDGFAISRALRRAADVPVLFLTARDAVEDRLEGFASGADDYLAKPFVLAELLARVAAVLRRTGRSEELAVGDLVLDTGACIARRAGVALELTATEWRLLEHLVRNQRRTLSKTQLLTQVWGYDDYDPNLVEVHVSALRRKIEAHGPRLVHTVRGVGYLARA